jgi:hypothetical protein
MQARRALVPHVLGTERELTCGCGEPFIWIVHAGNPPTRCATCKREARRAAKKKYLASNPNARAVERAGARRRYEADKPAIHLRNRAYRYGVAIDWILEREARGCAICGTTTRPSRGWSIDHDHVTGKARDVLCGLCNSGIGHFRDDPDLLLRAAKYVKHHHQQALEV